MIDLYTFVVLFAPAMALITNTNKFNDIWHGLKYHKKDHLEINWKVVEKADEELLKELKSKQK